MKQEHPGKLTDIFKTLGATKGSLAGNDPLLLTGSSHVWVVESGEVDLFVVKMEDGKPAGNLTPLTRYQAGDIFFGLERDTVSRTIGVLVRGGPDTVVHALVPHRLFSQGEHREVIARAVCQWVNSCIAGVTSKPLQREIKEAGDTLLKEDVIEALLETDALAASLDSFHRVFLSLISSQFDARQQQLRDHLQQKDDAAKAGVARGMQQLAAILYTGKKRPFIAGEGDDPLFTVCQEVGRSLNVHIRQPPRPEDEEDEGETDSIVEIARASHVRIRQIVLRGKWWRDDCGPLVGYVEEDGRPVALMPSKPGRYEIVDPTAKKREKVTAAVASGLSPMAHMMYRPFPGQQLNWWDLIKFGVAGKKQDVIWMVLMGAAGGILGMFVPLATGILFDSVIPGAERGQLFQVILALLAASLAGALFQITRGISVVRIQGGMNASLQAALWDRVLELPTTFFRRYTSGELASRTMGIQAINNILSDTVVTSILGGVFGVFNLLLLFYYSPRLAMVALLLVACGVVATAWTGRARKHHLTQYTAIQHKITGLVFQFLSGISKLRMTGSETKAFGIWAEMFSRQRKVSFIMERIQNRLEIFNSAYPHLATMCVFAAYAFLVQNEQVGYNEGLSTGEFLAFNAAFGSFIIVAIEMSAGLLSIMTIQPHYDNVLPILETLPETDDSRAAPGVLKGEIEVSNVCFRYIKDGPIILNELSIHIKPQQFVAIVGGSGCGKSTLLRLLLGFEVQESGAIFYDSKELSGIDIRMVRRQIGVVLQNAQLMGGDIFTNIVGAAANLTIDDAWRAARAVGLAEDIEDMPMGMHTIIAEGGGGLSGGQRQRLVIARAIVHEPKILFFDEATSALDNRTQAMVTESLEQLQATRVVIAHRLSTIKNADRIFAIDRGVLQESGTYEELMQRDGYFARLAKRQIA
jgi:NHLM bacteriocin system ABC transporter ATP-binding protein